MHFSSLLLIHLPVYQQMSQHCACLFLIVIHLPVYQQMSQHYACLFLIVCCNGDIIFLVRPCTCTGYVRVFLATAYICVSCACVYLCVYVCALHIYRTPWVCDRWVSGFTAACVCCCILHTACVHYCTRAGAAACMCVLLHVYVHCCVCALLHACVCSYLLCVYNAC